MPKELAASGLPKTGGKAGGAVACALVKWRAAYGAFRIELANYRFVIWVLASCRAYLPDIKHQ